MFLKKVLYKPSATTLFFIPYIFSNVQHISATRAIIDDKYN